MTGTFATGCAELLGSTSPCAPLRRRHDKHRRLDVTVRACRMLPEVLCAREATSPIMPFEVNTPMTLSLKPWTLVQIVTAPNIIDNLPPFPPFHLYPLISTLSAPLHASILSFDYSLRLLLPSCVFFSSFIHDIHERSYDKSPVTTTKDDPYELSSGNGGRCERCGEVVVLKRARRSGGPREGAFAPHPCML